MADIIEKLATAYCDSVIEASRLALECWDRKPSIQEFVSVAPGLVEAICNGIRQGQQNDALRVAGSAVCFSLLGAMRQVLDQVAVLREHDFEIEGLAEFHDSMTEIRHCIVELQDAVEGTQVPASNAEQDQRAFTAFEVYATSMPPAESWFEENHDEAKPLKGMAY
jgi:hypothetical protein